MDQIAYNPSDESFQGRDFAHLLRRNLKIFGISFAIALALGLSTYAFKIPYVGKGRLFVNDSQNSALQAFSTSYFGMTKTVVDGKKGNTEIGKQIEVLRTREFYEKLLDRLAPRSQNPSLSVEEQQAYKEINDKFLKDALKDADSRQSFILKLDSWFQSKLESDYEVKISFQTPSKALSLYLTNSALELASEYLRNREMAEIDQVENFIHSQLSETDKNIQQLTQELANYQSKPENLISMTSREKMGEYVSDLMVRMNEARLKIAENNKNIEFLQGEHKNAGTPKSSSLYGVGGRIESLRLENTMLETRLAELQDSVKRLGQQLKVLPVAVQMLEDKRKKSELEYARYKELTETLAKVEAEKFSIKDRFEILEKARGDNTQPLLGMMTMVLLSVIVAIMGGLTYLYMKYLWNPRAMQQEARASRGLSVVDSHNQDPRVVIENSKIKFQLGKHSTSE